MKTTLLGCFRKLVFPAALGLVAIAIGAGPAAATYPGANGRIVFTTGTNDLWSVLDDGSGLELLTTVLLRRESPRSRRTLHSRPTDRRSRSC